MARRSREQAEKTELPGIKHWLLAALAVLALMGVVPIFTYLL
jgi:hypothetical protein